MKKKPRPPHRKTNTLKQLHNQHVFNALVGTPLAGTTHTTHAGRANKPSTPGVIKRCLMRCHALTLGVRQTLHL